MAVTFARWILLLCALSAFVAFVGGFADVFASANDQKIVELWRLFGFIVFAGIFVLLALKPTRYVGIWELVIFHKLAMTVSAIFLIQESVEGAGVVAWVDGSLAVLLIVSYFLTKSYAAWNTFLQKTNTQP